MRIIRGIKEMSDMSRLLRRKGKTIGFVPTMGALHRGHLSLIRTARRQNDIVVVSIFVNPAQFGPKEDFKRYPRNLKLDAALCKKAGVDFIFYPYAKGVYPSDYKTFVTVQELGDILCGRFRPGHFQGVATVVTKLFNIVVPSVAYFGQKDAQQSIIIRRMTQDLNMAIQIKVLPTIRERDGLALSSRNSYLSEVERKDAPVLSQALRSAHQLIQSGRRDARRIIQKMRDLISKKESARIDYISIVDPVSLQPVTRIRGTVLIALAVWIGKTRLIDNITVKV